VSDHSQFRELIEGYALGSLDAPERALLETHLATDCSECADALEEARRVVSQLAYLAPSVEPPQQLRRTLMQVVRSEASGDERRSPTSGTVPWWMWGAVAALLLFGLYSTWNTQRLNNEIKRINDQMAAERRHNQDLLQERIAAQRQMRILTDPLSKKIMLPSKDAQMPELEAMWHPELGLCVMGHKVPMPADNHVFQLWLIPKAQGSKPMPVQTLWPEADGKLMRVVDNPPEPMWNTKAIAITEEPAGGSLQPTSEPMWEGGLT
jgi:anti-sigma-K factor RskA